MFDLSHIKRNKSRVVPSKLNHPKFSLHGIANYLAVVMLMISNAPPLGWCAQEDAEKLGPHSRIDFLHSKAPDIPPDTFGDFAIALKSAGIVSIKGATEDINRTRLNSICRKSHNLSFAELFEVLGRQTKSTPSYDAVSDCWNFKPPSMPLPYSLSIAPGWACEDRGQYECYIPKVQPVGMDIYMMGHFKNLEERDLKEIRDEQALQFADKVKPGVTLADMKKTIVDGCEALYFRSPAPMPGRQWRQWALVKNQQTFVIVSAVSDQNEKLLMPDVESMVASFRVLKPIDPYPGF